MDRETILNRLLPTLPDAKILDLRIGMHWSAVLVKLDGELRCGLSATLNPDSDCSTGGTLIAAGSYSTLPAREIAALVHSTHPVEVSLGMAAINALLPRHSHLWRDMHSVEVLARLGRERTVALVGHFPFVPDLRSRVGKLLVLEQHLKDEQDIPAVRAPEIIPQADVLAVTAMTLLNRTFDDLTALRRPGVPLVIIGPSVPLSPILFDLGADVLCGSIVEKPRPVLRGLSEGANFHQLKQLGVRLVTMTSGDLLDEPL